LSSRIRSNEEDIGLDYWKDDLQTQINDIESDIYTLEREIYTLENNPENPFSGALSSGGGPSGYTMEVIEYQMLDSSGFTESHVNISARTSINTVVSVGIGTKNASDNDSAAITGGFVGWNGDDYITVASQDDDINGQEIWLTVWGFK